MHEAGHTKLMFCDNREGSDGEEVERGNSGLRWHMFTYGQFILMYGKKHQYCKIIILQFSNKEKEKEKKSMLSQSSAWVHTYVWEETSVL